MSEKKESLPSFKKCLDDLKNSKTGEVRIVCSHTQRLLLERQLTRSIGGMFVDKRKYATTFHLPTGPKIILLHEKIVNAMYKSAVDIDLRKLSQEQIDQVFKLR